MAVTVPTMQELLEAGVHFGHKVSRGHPQMKPYIYGARDGVHIIDLAQSEELLKVAIDYVYNLGKNGGVLLLVGTKKQARELVEQLAHEVNTPYVTSRWLGGIMTNFDEVKRNINKLVALKKEQQAGQLSRYTKREQLLIARKIEKFDLVLGGVAEMTKIPDAIFVVDAVAEDIAIREAIRTNVKIVGFSDTNANPHDMDYPIPANDDGIKSIKIICEAVINAYGQGKKEAASDKVKADSKKAKEDLAKAEAPVLAGAVAEEAAVLEEEIEKVAIDESKSKVV